MVWGKYSIDNTNSFKNYYGIVQKRFFVLLTCASKVLSPQPNYQVVQKLQQSFVTLVEIDCKNTVLCFKISHFEKVSRPNCCLTLSTIITKLCCNFRTTWTHLQNMQCIVNSRKNSLHRWYEFRKLLISFLEPFYTIWITIGWFWCC